MSISHTDFLEVVYKICKLNGINEIKSCFRLNLGFNRIIYDVNDRFVVKISVNEEREYEIINEVNLLKSNHKDYMPTLYSFDLSKTMIPFMYTIEEKIKGYNLFDVWSNIDDNTRKFYLSNLIEIMRDMHQQTDCKELVLTKMMDEFDEYISKIKDKKILTSEKINYLNLLKSSLPLYFENAKFGNIHGDIHFNNLLVTDNGLKLIDYERYDVGPLDREFDPINRMVRNPNGLIKKGVQSLVNPKDYEMIMPYLIQNYSELCLDENFYDRLLIYDCFNSLRWLMLYPDHKQYQDILFDKSKKLIR